MACSWGARSRAEYLMYFLIGWALRSSWQGMTSGRSTPGGSSAWRRGNPQDRELVEEVHATGVHHLVYKALHDDDIIPDRAPGR